LKSEDITLPFDESTLEQDQEKMSEYLAQIKDIKRQLRNKEEYEEQYQTASTKLTAAKNQRDMIDGELAKLGDTDIVAVTTKNQEFHTAAVECEQAYSKAKQELSSIELSIKSFEQEIQKAEDLMQRRALLERRASNFDGLTKYLRNNRATFMAELWEQLMALTSQFVFEVTGGRIERIERSTDGDFWYVEEGRRAAYARLAGGFKAIAGVGLRLALASLLPAGMSLIVLDEPSSELRDDMAAALASVLRSQNRQIVMVTHRQGEEYTADTVIELEL
jgi:DNA repair exonuclease SbcCD ATPase subunit